MNSDLDRVMVKWPNVTVTFLLGVCALIYRLLEGVHFELCINVGLWAFTEMVPHVHVRDH